MSDSIFRNHLLQKIFDAMYDRNWPIQACTIAALVNEGFRNPKKSDEGILMFDASGKNQWWLGLGEDPVSQRPVIKVCSLDIFDMFVAPIEDYHNDLSKYLDKIEEHLNPTLAKK